MSWYILASLLFLVFEIQFCSWISSGSNAVAKVMNYYLCHVVLWYNDTVTGPGVTLGDKLRHPYCTHICISIIYLLALEIHKPNNGKVFIFYVLR